MTGAYGHIVIDADAHLVETAETWESVPSSADALPAAGRTR